MGPKIGSKAYKPSKDEMGDDDEKEEESKVSTKSFDVLLKEWGFEKYIDKMREQGWDDTDDWQDITDADLKNDIGFSKGHIKKWKRNINKWTKPKQEQNKQKELEEQRKAVAIVQEQIYGNVQPMLKLKNDSKKKSAPNCPGMHGLNPFVTPGSYGCNGCLKLFQKGELMYECKNCEYDLCTNCMHRASTQYGVKSSENMAPYDMFSSFLDEDDALSNCPGMHGLKRKKVRDIGCGGYICDLCDRSINKNAVVYDCRICNYGLCQKCEREGNFVESDSNSLPLYY